MEDFLTVQALLNLERLISQEIGDLKLMEVHGMSVMFGLHNNVRQMFHQQTHHTLPIQLWVK